MANDAAARGPDQVLRGLLALIILVLAGIGNEIRYQGCISRQVAEVRLVLEGHEVVRPAQCHRMPFL